MSADNTNKPNNLKIPVPFSRRVKSFFRKFVPVVVWLGAAAGLVVLSQGRLHRVDAVGIVRRNGVWVAPLVACKIQSVAVQEFDIVRQGDVVAILDDSVLQAERRIAQAELVRLRADLDAARRQLEYETQTAHQETKRDIGNDQRRFELNEEEARLDLLDRNIDLEADRVELARLATLLRFEQNLENKNVGTRITLEDIKYQHAMIEKKIEESRKAIAYATERLAEATRRKAAYVPPEAIAPPAETLSPLSLAISVQEKVIAEINERTKQMVLTAPQDGVITSIDCKPGEAVMAGIPILEIDSTLSTQVVAWVDERMIAGIQEGAPVELISRRRPRTVVPAKVLKVGRTVESFPLRLYPNPNLPRWGLAILVGEIDSGLFNSFYPGEVLDVRFLPSGGEIRS